MRNFPYQELPQKWEKYYGQGHAVALAHLWIKQGASGLPRSLFISGKSGTGKTSFVKLLMRSFRCLNRTSDSVEPCGTCAACTDLDERIGDRTLTDIHWVQPGGYSEEETLNKQVRTALAAAAKGHRHTDRPSHDVTWIVFDEWQNFATNLRQEILIRTEMEIPGNNVCYIFVTMQEERLSEEDRIALMSRGLPLKFRQFTSTEISKFLERYDLDKQSRSLLAEGSRGSIRLAQAYLDQCRQLDPTFSPEALAKITGAAPDNWRWELWSYLENKQKFSEIKSLIDSILEYIDKDTIIKHLQQDLMNSIDSMSNLNDDHSFALFNLTQMQNNINCELLSGLAVLYGMKLVTKDAVFKSNVLTYCREDV